MNQHKHKRGKTPHPENRTADDSQQATEVVGSDTPPSPSPQQNSNGSKNDGPRYKKFLEWSAVVIALGLLVVNIFQSCATQKAAIAAQSAATTANASLILANRPWIKVSPIISKALQFGISANGGAVAGAEIQNTLENVGSSVALDVISWEDIIPLDPGGYPGTAVARQNEWCGANRHPNRSSFRGYALFPKDPLVATSHIGPKMEVVSKAVAAEPTYLKGKVGFVLAGCVCYRAPFEPETAATHQTRFIYFLTKATPEGLINPYIDPVGTASDLVLVPFPSGQTAD